MTTTYQLNPMHRPMYRNVILLASLVMMLLLIGDASAAFRHGIPDDGNWRFKLDLDHFAEGNRWRYCEHNCANPDLRNGDFNDQASSYTVCNRTGRRIDVRVRFWRHVGYHDLVYDDTIYLLDGECHVANLPDAINDDISSFHVYRRR